MFDIGWSELLIIAVATLIVVGPKDLPVFLRTIGKYVGVLKRQASEFRTQFDDALRETEFEQLKSDVESIKSDFESTVRDTTAGLTSELDDVKKSLDEAAKVPQLEAQGSSDATGSDAKSESESATRTETEAEENGDITETVAPAGAGADVNTLNNTAISDVAANDSSVDASPPELAEAVDDVDGAAADGADVRKKTAGA